MDLARRRRGLSKRSLAEALAVSPRMITAYERGDKLPSDATRRRLSEVLDFPEPFFLGPDLEAVEPEASSFRAATRLTARQRHQALAAGTLALTMSDWIEARFELPETAIPKYQGVDPETAAEAVRAEWGLGEQRISNMLHLLEAHGVRVFSLIQECRAMDAFSFWRGERPYALVNTTKSAERRRMDLAHELGHLVLHWRGGAQGRVAEHEADQFGSAFLMPAGSMFAQAPRNSPSPDDLVQAKELWGVSVAALAYRMHRLGLSTDWEYRSLFIEIGKRGWRVSEPFGGQPETSSLLDTVFKLLRESGESASDIASDLGITSDELSGLVFGLVLTPAPPATRPVTRTPRSEGGRAPDLRLV